MAFLSNLSTRAKLLIGFGLMIVLLATVSIIAYRDMERLKASQNALFQDDLSMAFKLLELRNTINRERVALLSLALANASEQPVILQNLESETKEIAAILDALGKKAQKIGLENKVKKIIDAREDYSAIRDKDVLPMLQAGKRAEAAVVIIGPLQEKFLLLRAIADEIGAQQFAEAEMRMRHAETIVENAKNAIIVANLVALLVGLILVFWLDRIIAQPLKQATLAAQQIATGDLTVNVPLSPRNDEVGQLMHALDAMVGAWRQLIRETNAGISTLSAAASEILAGTMQVAAGATETAAAVSETTATVEEVKQTALLASQKARTVSETAQKAVQIADSGRKAIEDGITGMGSVQDQMESIAETIVRLSESSQAIAEIIASVSSLAEQSNLLAVNAAIEAAKAGEQGKGFTVVAQEVKDLADQSKQATKQVRIILSDIQKAISAAVMTTEQGSRTVASGVEQATEAGGAIKILSESILDAAQVAAQIAATSQQQLAGMDQVALAMENIKQVSTENAAGSRQSEASAQNLHSLGQKLKQMSEQFKL